MRSTHTRLFVHCIWGTWNRAPIITPQLEEAIFSDIRAECEKVGAEVVELNGTEDHVHALVRFPPTIAIADLVKQMKGASSHLATHKVVGKGNFKWQGAYAAFTVSEYEVNKVRNYIRNQTEHHRDNKVINRYELQMTESNPEE